MESVVCLLHKEKFLFSFYFLQKKNYSKSPDFYLHFPYVPTNMYVKDDVRIYFGIHQLPTDNAAFLYEVNFSPDSENFLQIWKFFPQICRFFWQICGFLLFFQIFSHLCGFSPHRFLNFSLRCQVKIRKKR